MQQTRDSSARVYLLLLAHENPKDAVAVAYVWDWSVSEEDILERLLALNLARAAQQA